MSATAALSLVPMDARRGPEQMALLPVMCRPLFLVGIEFRQPDEVTAFLREHRERRPPVRAWRNPLRVRTVEGGGDLLGWTAPTRKAPRRAPAARPKRAPGVPAVAPAPIRPAAMRVLSDEIILPRSRRRKAAVPRRMLAGESHESLGNAPLSRAEREGLARDLEFLGDVRFGPPAHDRDCPTGPCAHVGCRHNTYLEVKQDRTILNWPGRHVDELEETCSLRAARAAAAKRQESDRPNGPAMSYPEIGRILNLTAQSVCNDEKSALAKLRAAGIHLRPLAD